MGMNVVPRLVPPQGLSGVIEHYGDIRTYVRPDGTLRSEWEHHYLAFCGLPAPLPLGWDLETKVSRIRCHVRLVDAFRVVFERLHGRGLWPEVRTFDGCFAYRPQRGSAGKLSLHAWGAAIDLNASTNPLGVVGDMHPGVVEAFEEQGFVWGGRWRRPDGMHFQAAAGY